MFVTFIKKTRLLVNEINDLLLQNVFSYKAFDKIVLFESLY